MSAVYITPEQAVSEFGYDDQNRPLVTKHAIRRYAKESGIHSTLSRGKMAFTQEDLDSLKAFVVSKNQNQIKTTTTGEIDNFA